MYDPEIPGSNSGIGISVRWDTGGDCVSTQWTSAGLHSNVLALQCPWFPIKEKCFHK